MNDRTSPPSRLSRLLFAPFGTEYALLVMRLWFGAMLIQHGSGKVFGDLTNFTATVAKLGFPAPEVFAWAAALSEFAGGIAITLGLGTRIAALFVAGTMFVAAILQHASDPFGKKELALTYLVLALVVFIAGPGRFSVDGMIARRMHR